MKKQHTQWQAEYERLKRQLGHSGWISEGYVQDRGPGAGGPCYQWTRKVRGKTVSVALSREQYQWLKEAIAHWRLMQQTIKEMQRLSRQVLFATVPHPPRRKKLGKKALGLI
jgi:cyclopropane fatty-acyl-phospholipid synthase-like methyltransferase